MAFNFYSSIGASCSNSKLLRSQEAEQSLEPVIRDLREGLEGISYSYHKRTYWKLIKSPIEIQPFPQLEETVSRFLASPSGVRKDEATTKPK